MRHTWHSNQDTAIPSLQNCLLLRKPASLQWMSFTQCYYCTASNWVYFQKDENIFAILANTGMAKDVEIILHKSQGPVCLSCYSIPWFLMFWPGSPELYKFHHQKGSIHHIKLTHLSLRNVVVVFRVYSWNTFYGLCLLALLVKLVSCLCHRTLLRKSISHH